MKDWIEVAAIVASFIVFCIVTSYLAMSFLGHLAQTMPAPMW